MMTADCKSLFRTGDRLPVSRLHLPSPCCRQMFSGVLTDSGRPSDLLQEPDVPVKPDLILTLDSRTSGPAFTGKFFRFAKVPSFRKDKFCAFFQGGQKVRLPRDKTVVFVKSTPMNPAVCPFSCLRVDLRRLSTCVTVSFINVDSNPALGFWIRFSWRATPPIYSTILSRKNT